MRLDVLLLLPPLLLLLMLPCRCFADSEPRVFDTSSLQILVNFAELVSPLLTRGHKGVGHVCFKFSSRACV
jgi:hypothetical protein